MVMPNLSVSAGGGGPSNATSSAGVNTSTNTPFNFDDSGWVINFGDGNAVKAEGNSGANQAAQSPASGGLLGSLGGLNPNMLLIGAAVLLLLRRK
ncbi:hypothetical protein [Duganella violaceipulchra]|uniref:Uncharacterized protein n=1 Tax=Duganella violaceipulchra TaxID=2849652 RepID=A0AA41HE43_9BURK|nr:hypothetical protein [Duganella violaceicalia]MBV6324365.1 hypothetical protein [Duganella violaceicalia]MCP2007242.1 hypothetical protein [Duganella violaceicalia]